MKALIVTYIILISLASAVALVDCSDESQFNQLQALEMGSSDHSDLITKTMVGFDNIISLDFQPKVEDITINEVSDNLNSIINSKTYISPYEIKIPIDAWFENSVGNQLIFLIQKDRALEVELSGIENQGNVDLTGDINTIFRDSIVLNEESSNEKDVEDAFRITDAHYEESITYSSGNTYYVAPS
jgi:hypothetical protein